MLDTGNFKVLLFSLLYVIIHELRMVSHAFIQRIIHQIMCESIIFFFFSVITFKLPIEIKCIFWQIQCPWIFWRKQVNRNHSCYHTIIFNTRAFQCASILWLTLRKSLSKTVDNRQVGKVFSWIGSYALTNECREKPV